MLVSSGNADVRGLAHREPTPASEEPAPKRANLDERNVLQNRTWVLYLGNFHMFEFPRNFLMTNSSCISDSMKWSELLEISGPVPPPRYSHTIGYVEGERLICV